MKRVIIIISLLVAGIFVSQAQEDCDTLKWKIIKTYYNDNYYNRVGELNGAVINVDTLSAICIGIDFVNISNDTFAANGEITFLDFCRLYADTGVLKMGFPPRGWKWVLDDTEGSMLFLNPISCSLSRDFLPNDSIRMVVEIKFDLLYAINQLKTTRGIDFENISFWEMTIGIVQTDKDGFYSDSVFWEGMNTSTFRVVKGGVGIVPITNYELRVYPNPTTAQLRITNYELRNAVDYTIYSVMGQKIIQGKLQDETTVVNVETLAKGMYYLRVAEKTVKFVKE